MLGVHSHNNSLFLSLLSLFLAHRQETWQKATNQSQHRACYYVSLESSPLNSGRKVLARLICRVKVPHLSERLLDKWDLTAVFSPERWKEETLQRFLKQKQPKLSISSPMRNTVNSCQAFEICVGLYMEADLVKGRRGEGRQNPEWIKSLCVYNREQRLHVS